MTGTWVVVIVCSIKCPCAPKDWHCQVGFPAKYAPLTSELGLVWTQVVLIGTGELEGLCRVHCDALDGRQRILGSDFYSQKGLGCFLFLEVHAGKERSQHSPLRCQPTLTACQSLTPNLIFHVRNGIKINGIQGYLMRLVGDSECECP